MLIVQEIWSSLSFHDESLYMHIEDFARIAAVERGALRSTNVSDAVLRNGISIDRQSPIQFNSFHPSVNFVLSFQTDADAPSQAKSRSKDDPVEIC